MANEVQIIISGTSAGADKAFKGVQSSFAKLRAGIMGHSKAIGLGMTAMGGAIVGSLGLALKSYQQQEIGINRLDLALRNVGVSYAGQKAEIEAVIEAQQRKTNFGDEAQRDALQKLVTIGGKWEGTLDALRVTTDVAAGASIDLNAAALLVGKAIAGETSSLSRYGIILEKGATQTEIMAALTKQFGGAAEAAADPLTQLKNRMGDVFQSLVAELMPAINKAATVIEKIARRIIEFTEAHPELVKWLGVAAGAIGGLMLVLGPLLIALPAIAAGFGVLGGAITVATGPVGLIVVAIAGLIAMATKMGADWGKIWDTVKVAIQGAGRVITNAIDGIKGALSFLPGLPGLWDDATSAVERQRTAVQNLTSDMDGLSVAKLQSRLIELNKLEDEAVQRLKDLDITGIRDAVREAGRMVFPAIFKGPEFSREEILADLRRVKDAQSKNQEQLKSLEQATIQETIATENLTRVLALAEGGLRDWANAYFDAASVVVESATAMTTSTQQAVGTISDELAELQAAEDSFAQHVSGVREKSLAAFMTNMNRRLASERAAAVVNQNLADVKEQLETQIADTRQRFHDDFMSQIQTSIDTRERADSAAATLAANELARQEQLNGAFNRQTESLLFNFSAQGQAWKELGGNAESVIEAMIATTGGAAAKIIADLIAMRTEGESFKELLLRLDTEGTINLENLAAAWENLGKSAKKALDVIPKSQQDAAAKAANLAGQRASAQLDVTGFQNLSAEASAAGGPIPTWVTEGLAEAVSRLNAIPTRAHGGPLRAGQAALVGELGPEIFRANTGGTVIPNNKLGGSLTINFTFNGDVVAQDFEERVQRSVLDALNAGGYPQLARA